ncbi:MAG: leucyl aminopeptidase family protein [Gammaproteobacteria bacterium]|nr:leucyl aminopeptidase family protein [Gammaproteobacteria bacterium]
MQLRNPKITQDSRTLTAKSCEIETNIILLVAAGPAPFAHAPHGAALVQRLARAGRTLGDAKPFVIDLPSTMGSRLATAAVTPALSSFELLTLARQLVAAHTAHRLPKRLAIACLGLAPAEAERACEAVVTATLSAAFALPDYKSHREKSPRLEEIRIYGHRDPTGYRRSLAEASGNNLARWLTALPPNELTPGRYRRQVAQLARRYGWTTTFLDQKKLRARGAGAFLAVAQGSPEADAGIVRLRYRPRRKTTKPPLALVGKGICFDTGGTNLKTARHMHGMHEDMEGSAVALGTLLALTELKVDFPVDCWLALAQNHIGPKAYKQNDVVTAANGTTIEVVHTDAEGRMVLADTLYFASQQRPRLIVDYATLTGACVGALSTRLSGALTNRVEFIPVLIAAGWASGERVWPFPLETDFEKALKSDVADIKQCTLESDADHILAAVFLRKFIAHDTPWVHIDLSAGNHKGGLAHIPTAITGFGVRFTLNLLFDQQLWA